MFGQKDFRFVSGQLVKMSAQVKLWKSPVLIYVWPNLLSTISKQRVPLKD